MTSIFNRRELKAKRKQLRNNMTRTEIILWSKLKNSQLAGLKFRRQASIKNYIVDFYCPLRKVAVELDGDVHAYKSRIISDADRQSEIESLGIKVIRFTNREVFESLDGVLREILKACEKSQEQPHVNRFLEKEGENSNAEP